MTSTTYNAAGEVDTVTDPRGIQNKTIYDSLGRVLYTIAAWDGTYDPTTGDQPSGGTGSDVNQTTAYTYDGVGHTLTMTAINPSGQDNQTTKYVYGITSPIASHDVLQKIEYPDASTGEASSSSSNQVSYTYNQIGEVLTKTDQNGTVHTYTYDNLGRETLDAVTTPGTGVDNAILAIGTTYNAQGLVDTVTSYATDYVNPDQIVNQVKDVYNGLGQLVTEYQSHVGAVDTSSTPSVQYAYSSPSNGSRLVSMTYPSGQVLHYGYDGNTLDNAIGRLDTLTDNSSSTLVSYQYMGDSTVVSETEGNGMVMTLITIPGLGSTNTDGGDQYTGLDRFGQVIDQVYVNGSGDVIGRTQYAYDRDGNVTAENNLLDSSLNQGYTFDNLGRITAMTRGGSAYQSWTLDALGNASSITTSGSTQIRSTNDQNQLTSVGSATLTYDHNGNVTTDDQGHTLIYDAWNQLVIVKNGSTVITTYAYDGNGQRITESPTSGTASDLYYSSNWQVIEERQGTTTYQYVQDPMGGSDSLILRDTIVSGSFSARLYVQQNLDNLNVIALVSSTGLVLERYEYNEYNEYGTVLILNSDFTDKTGGTGYNWVYLYQGHRRDLSVGLDDFRNRVYSASLETFAQPDPSGYPDGLNANAAYFAMRGGMDSTGLEDDENPEEQKVDGVPQQFPPGVGHYESGGDGDGGEIGAPSAPRSTWWQTITSFFSSGNAEPSETAPKVVPPADAEPSGESSGGSWWDNLKSMVGWSSSSTETTPSNIPVIDDRVLQEAERDATSKPPEIKVDTARLEKFFEESAENKAAEESKSAQERAVHNYENVSSTPKDAEDLKRQLTSEEQMSDAMQGKGESIAGAGNKDGVPLRVAESLAKTYGGIPDDWAKMSSESSSEHDVTMPNGDNFETHWYQNIKTGQVVEIKTKIEGH